MTKKRSVFFYGLKRSLKNLTPQSLLLAFIPPVSSFYADFRRLLGNTTIAFFSTSPKIAILLTSISYVPFIIIRFFFFFPFLSPIPNIGLELVLFNFDVLPLQADQHLNAICTFIEFRHLTFSLDLTFSIPVQLLADPCQLLPLSFCDSLILIFCGLVFLSPD